MKTLKSIMFGLALLVVCGVANAKTQKGNDGLSKDEVVNVYVDAISHGKVDALNQIVESDAQFNMWRGDKSTTMTKEQMLDYLKSTQLSNQDFTTTSSVVEDNDYSTTLKVEMKFDTYTRVNVITLVHHTKGWKITKVDTSFK